MTAVKLCYTHKHLSAINTKLTVNTYHYSDIVKQDEWQLKSSATPHTVLAFATKIFELKLDSSTIITLFVSFLQSIYDRILVPHLFLQLSRTNGIELLGCRFQLDKDYGASCTVPIPWMNIAGRYVTDRGPSLRILFSYMLIWRKPAQQRQ